MLIGCFVATILAYQHWLINQGNADRSHRKVFIGGLNYNSTEESLKSHFSKFGELVDVVVMKFPDTQRYVNV